jgi:hypothetical protein
MEVSMRAAVLGVLLATGCAPSARALVEKHHAREALCALGSVSPDDEVLIREGLMRDLAPRVQVSRVDVGANDFHAVIVRLSTNAIPIDELRVGATRSTPGVFVWDRPSLARLTHETLPSARTVSPGALEGFGIFMVAVMTVGIVRLDSSPTRTEYPSPEEIERAAPRASELARLLASECTRAPARGVGVRCTLAFAVRDADGPSSVDLDLELTANTEARSTCRMHNELHVPLDAP